MRLFLHYLAQIIRLVEENKKSCHDSFITVKRRSPLEYQLKDITLRKKTYRVYELINANKKQ